MTVTRRLIRMTLKLRTICVPFLVSDLACLVCTLQIKVVSLNVHRLLAAAETQTVGFLKYAVRVQLVLVWLSGLPGRW